MKKIFFISLFILITSMLNASELNKHHKLLIGSLNFSTTKYYNYGYSKSEWHVITTFVNKNIFQQELSWYLWDDFYINLADENTVTYEKYTWYYLRPTILRLDYDLRRMDALINIIDLDTNECESSFMLKITTPDGIYPKKREYGLTMLANQLAYAIASKIKGIE